MSGKFALIIGNTEYTDKGLAQLSAPGKDTKDFARILKDPSICAFDDVKVVLNQTDAVVREAIDEFFDQKRSDDLLVLYFSGHGIRDEFGALYLAVKNTNRFRLRSTAIKSGFIQEVMDQSLSRRQVLILDCCNSGAFAQGTKAATGVSIGTASAFEAGTGRIILTASDAIQFAWEGDKVIGETGNSLFTHFLVKGLEGEADLDGDGSITVDELYDYTFEQVKRATPKQTPSKFSSQQKGEIVLRQITRIADIKPVALSDELISEIENSYPEVRLRAVQQLTRLLNGRNLGLARSAREALERMEKEDDSRRVVQAAAQALEPIRQAEGIAPPRPVGPGTGGASGRKVNIEALLGKLKSFFAAKSDKRRPRVRRPTTAFFALVLMALLFGVWISLPALVFLSSNSASEQATMAPIPSIEITNSDYTANHMLFNGMLIDVEAKTTFAQKGRPCEVIVYFQRIADEDLIASRSLPTIISPYIAKDGRVSVYTDFVPSYDRSIWSFKLFMPYAAIGAGGLPQGDSLITYYAELRGKDYELLSRSDPVAFIFKK